jgi:1-pyrroline-5-carboxylate dehydrogenase
MDFKLTYSTMFDPPAALHERFEAALGKVRAALGAFPGWQRTSPAERIRILRQAAAPIEQRVYEIGAAVALEVGKNRMEALGEVQETATFFTAYCKDYERHGFDHALPDDPLADYRSHNRSVTKAYGVWL